MLQNMRTPFSGCARRPNSLLRAELGDFAFLCTRLSHAPSNKSAYGPQAKASRTQARSHPAPFPILKNYYADVPSAQNTK